jgi:hypothetical protein
LNIDNEASAGAGIVVGSKGKLPPVIDTLIAAVRAGELDERSPRGQVWRDR